MPRDQQAINERRKERYRTDPEFRQKQLDSAKRYHKRKRETDPEYLKNRAEYNKKNAKYFSDKQREYNQARPFHYAFKRLKLRAKNNDIPFNLDEEYMIEIWTGRCAIFDTLLETPYSTERRDDNKATMDRIVPELGYVKGNVAWVSNRANIIKSFGSLYDHQKIIEYISERLTEIDTKTEENYNS